MTEIKGVVFDLDHTLFDRYETFMALQTDFYNELKKYLSDDVSPRDIYIALTDGDKKYLYKGWDYIARYVFSLGYFKTPISEKAFKEIIFSCFGRKAIPYSFVPSMLSDLKSKGYKLGLITNGESSLQRKKISMLNLEDAFDEIIISGEFGERKPHISIFKEMSKRLSIPENHLIYVGDHPINDIDAASKAGYKTVWIKTNGTWVQGCEKPCFELDTVEHLSDLLESLADNKA
jgi:putative hydrolase of the HAD superfamily